MHSLDQSHHLQPLKEVQQTSLSLADSLWSMAIMVKIKACLNRKTKKSADSLHSISSLCQSYATQQNAQIRTTIQDEKVKFFDNSTGSHITHQKLATC